MSKPYPYETATKAQQKPGAWWWCVHHECHIERLDESTVIGGNPLLERVNYIKEWKPKREIATRLRMMAPILNPGKLPKELRDAERAHVRAEKKWNCLMSDVSRRTTKAARAIRDSLEEKADAAYDKAIARCKKAERTCKVALREQHDQEYPDNTWNGHNIFGKKGRP